MLQRRFTQTQTESGCSTYGNVEPDCDTIGSSNAAFFDIGNMCHASTQTECQAGQWRLLSADVADAQTLHQLKGEWVPIDVLQPQDIVKIKLPFVDSTVGVQIQLPQDMIGRVLCIDAEGDAEVRFPDLIALLPKERNRWILSGSFRNLVKHKNSEGV